MRARPSSPDIFRNTLDNTAPTTTTAFALQYNLAIGMLLALDQSADIAPSTGCCNVPRQIDTLVQKAKDSDGNLMRVAA